MHHAPRVHAQNATPRWLPLPRCLTNTRKPFCVAPKLVHLADWHQFNCTVPGMEQLRGLSGEAALAHLGALKRPELQKLAKESGVKVPPCVSALRLMLGALRTELPLIQRTNSLAELT